MILLITSDKPRFFLPIFMIIFILYSIWDFLSVREHLGQYTIPPLPTNDRRLAKLGQIYSIYYGGFVNSGTTNRGPIITLSWMLYFVVLALLDRTPSRYHVKTMVALAILRLIVYRLDKSHKLAGDLTRGLTMGFRVMIILIMLVVGAIVIYSTSTNISI